MSRKNRSIGRVECEDAALDMSPMIDMVFQLIIFFMVTATLVTLKKDPEVRVPVAPKGKVSDSALGRVLVNVYSDEVMRKKGFTSPFSDEQMKELAFDQITDLVRQKKEENDAAGVKPTILMLRGDRISIVRRTKEALAAAGAAGVNDVIFSALQDDYKQQP
jgi:biopolymer transport protein ExbD